MLAQTRIPDQELRKCRDVGEAVTCLVSTAMMRGKLFLLLRQYEVMVWQ
jgi:hypothetical protein